MSTKELIQAELDPLVTEASTVYTVIKQFIESKRHAKPRSLMATLRDIQIDRPRLCRQSRSVCEWGEACQTGSSLIRSS